MMNLNDWIVDIVREKFDLVIMTSELQGSSLIVRRLASCPFVLGHGRGGCYLYKSTKELNWS